MSSNELKFNKEYNIEYNDRKYNINTLNDYLKVILTSIGITDSELIKNIMDKFNYNKESVELFKSQKAETLIKNLIIADIILNDTIMNKDDKLGMYYNNDPKFKQNWDSLMSEFITLQGLIILRKVTKNVKVGFDSLITAFGNKLQAINNLLEDELKS